MTKCIKCHGPIAISPPVAPLCLSCVNAMASERLRVAMAAIDKATERIMNAPLYYHGVNTTDLHSCPTTPSVSFMGAMIAARERKTELDYLLNWLYEPR
jgi:hypothetical protein